MFNECTGGLMENSIEKNRLLIKLCQMYYEEGLTQQEIAKRFGVSRPHISRMLTTAKNEKLVEIIIHNPYKNEQNLEKAFIEKFGIREVIVINYEESKPLLTSLAEAVSAFLESTVQDNQVIGVMAGKTIAEVTKTIEYFPRNNLQFVPLVGGWDSEGNEYNANTNTMHIANKMKSKYKLLHVPAIVKSVEVATLLKEEKGIQEVLLFAQKCDIALIGIGDVSSNATIYTSKNLPEQALEDLINLGAVANICASFLDKTGNIISQSIIEKRMIGLHAQELRSIPSVIAVAGGNQKINAIKAVLQGKWVDVLIIDSQTAKAVLKTL